MLWPLAAVSVACLGEAVAVTAILGLKARGLRSSVTSIACFLSASCWMLLWQCLQLHSSQYMPAAKHSQYSFRHLLFLQLQLRQRRGAADGADTPTTPGEPTELTDSGASEPAAAPLLPPPPPLPPALLPLPLPPPEEAEEAPYRLSVLGLAVSEWRCTVACAACCSAEAAAAELVAGEWEWEW